MSSKSKDGLNKQQREFVVQYIKEKHNATKAYQLAYMKKGKPAISDKVAQANSSRLLSNAKVQKAIDVAEAEALKDLGIEANDVLAETARLAFLDPRKMFRDGMYLPIHLLPDDIAVCISSIEFEVKTVEINGEEGMVPIRTVKVRFWDKTKALDLLGRYHKLWGDREGGPPGAVTFGAMLERAKQLRAENAKRRVGK